ncbi:MAG: hypothetical protein QNJ46_14415 [Leptolyngbyaceae cyanobacterium MO_188.B28]|nr:hypothetical protein [Leptolyngbyaceae cyanobacterium MO_188.B28]
MLAQSASPVAAYDGGGERAVSTVTAQWDWIDKRTAMLETLASMERAGANVILTYFAKAAALALRG